MLGGNEFEAKQPNLCHLEQRMKRELSDAPLALLSSRAGEWKL